jgi:hypothetical protein
MESGHIAAIAIASIIACTIGISAIAQAWLSARSRGENLQGGSLPKRLDALEERLYRLEHAIDSVAVEVERGSEAQRFTAKLLAERLDGGPAGRVASGSGQL